MYWILLKPLFHSPNSSVIIPTIVTVVKLRSRSRSQVRSRSGPVQVPGQVQKVQGLRAKDLDLS